MLVMVYYTLQYIVGVLIQGVHTRSQAVAKVEPTVLVVTDR